MDHDFVKGAIIGCSVGIAAGMLANWQDVELNLDDSTKTLAPLGQLTRDDTCKEYHKAHLAVRQALEAAAEGKPLPPVLVECLKKPVKEPAASQSLKNGRLSINRTRVPSSLAEGLMKKPASPATDVKVIVARYKSAIAW